MFRLDVVVVFSDTRRGVFCHACHASSVTVWFSVVFHRQVSYVDFQCDYIVAFAGENPFSFHRENLLRINLVTLTDE